MKKILTLLCALLMLSACTSGSNPSEDIEKQEEQTTTEDKIEIVISGNSVEFGSYPQREIVAEANDSGVYGKTWAKEDDTIIDSDLYNTLKNLPEEQWNACGDTTIDNNKYRRIRVDDATCSNDDVNYYSWSSLEEYHYFKYEPIRWKILQQGDNDLFLLCETALDGQMYNTEIKNMTWQTSTIRSWLNGYGSEENLYGTDYSDDNFIDTAFTTQEQAMIKTTLVKNNDNIKNGTEAGEDTNDLIFLLSEEEVYGETATGYGFAEDYNEHDAARQMKSTTYAKAMGVYAESESDTLGNCFWWLRSPGSYTGLFILIRPNGSVYRGGQHANSKTRGVCPAMHIMINQE